MADVLNGTFGRLKKRAEFLAVQSGLRLRGPLFLLEVKRRNDDLAARIGFTVTRKQGNAVERNRIRRRLREAVRISCGGEMRPGHDYVLVGRRDTLGVPFETLTRELTMRLTKAGGAHRDKLDKAVGHGQ